MKILLQRVKKATVESGDYVAEIGAGLLLFIGITHTDTVKEADYLADKCVNLRVFEDENGKMNYSVIATKGEILAIPQFTLYGDATHGRRPSYTESAKPEMANKLITYFIDKLKSYNISVKRGCFGEDMDILLTNDGPVTLMLEK